MTNLATRKSRLVFTSCDLVRECGKFREVVIEAHPQHASIRLKGLHTSYDIPWSAVWSMAVKAQLAHDRAEKLAKKKRGVA